METKYQKALFKRALLLFLCRFLRPNFLYFLRLLCNNLFSRREELMICFDKKLVWLSTREIHLKNSAFIENISDSELISLTESIFENGILEPLIIRKVSLKGYELVSGFRRYLAAKRLKLRRVPCIVCTADDKTAALIRLSDNLCRFIPSYLEEAKEMHSAMACLIWI